MAAVLDTAPVSGQLGGAGVKNQLNGQLGVVIATLEEVALAKGVADRNGEAVKVGVILGVWVRVGKVVRVIVTEGVTVGVSVMVGVSVSGGVGVRRTARLRVSTPVGDISAVGLAITASLGENNCKGVVVGGGSVSSATRRGPARVGSGSAVSQPVTINSVMASKAHQRRMGC